MRHPIKTWFQVEKLYILLLIYCAASLFHFVHNAVFIADYPNMPVSTTAIKVVAAWLAITGVGIMGYLLMRRGRRFPALVLFAIYGALGLDGLGHYTLAPLSAHTFTMNLTIWLEVTTAVFVLIAVAGWMVRLWRGTAQTV